MRSLAVLDELPVLILHFRPDGECDYCNRRWFEFTGRTLEEEPGSDCRDHIHPDDLPAVRSQFRAARLDRSSRELEVRLRRHDGAYRWFLIALAPSSAPDGTCGGYLATCTDLTGMTGAMATVRRRLTLLEHARDAMIMESAEGEIREANHAAELMYGYTRQELLSMNARDLRASRSRGSLPADMARAWRDGCLLETIHVRKDGTEFHAEVNSQAVRVNGEQLLVCVIRDVGGSHRLERQLRASEARYRSLFENMREGVAIQELVRENDVATNYCLLDVNPAFCAHMGVSRQAAVGRLATEVYGTPSAPYLEAFESVVATAQCTSFESYFAPLNRHLSVSVFPLSGTHFATIVTDVTERKRVEEQFRQSQKMEAVGRLAGGIAHDFNNLLTIILAHADMLLEGVGSGPLRSGIESINDAGERAAKLTSQLLTFSRKQVIQPQTLDLNQVVAETGDMMRRIIGEDIELEIVPGENLRLIRGDAGQIEQVILNLVVNARDAMPHGGRLSIETSNVSVQGSAEPGAIPPGGYVLLSVSDTGVGMSAEVRSHLFEPFFTTKPKGRGTGLGLSTVYGIVKQCGGEVMVESEEGAGTRFDIYLPAVAGDPVPHTRRRAAIERGSGRESILLAEDDRNVRELVSRLLGDLGYNVVAVANGQEALTPLRTAGQNLDLLLTDVVMPGMSGPELAACAATIRPGLPVLYISGYPDVTVTHDGAEVDPERFVQKPFTVEVLNGKIRRLLDHS
ncbi:MAG TPA: PAS domain S-box protein [Bryobacteraceae bacterium]|nr:PAS domain S-box protein [Bryobacteraceae bacterium]